MKKVKTQSSSNILSLIEFFSIIEDPRINRTKQFSLVNILVFTFVALLSDQASWYQIQEFCLTNVNWFAEFLDISSGVPSHDTFRRVLGLVDSSQLEIALIEWLEKTREKFGIHRRRIIALDGKSLRGVAWKVNEKQLHILNGWDATENRFIGQLSIEEKTNEITAAPKMLAMLQLENTVITVDAMMTQKEIAKIITDKQGDYVMALKGNQGTLFENVKLYFTEKHIGIHCARTIEKNRGQVEIRTCTKTDEISWLHQKKEWEKLKSIFVIEAETIKGEKTTRESRYYITSLEAGASEFLEIVRKHWSVENQLHRTLDVHFKEDACQVHDRKAASNLSVLRKLAITLLKQIDPKKTLISKIKKAAYSPEFRRKCLLGII